MRHHRLPAAPCLFTPLTLLRIFLRAFLRMLVLASLLLPARHAGAVPMLLIEPDCAGLLREFPMTDAARGFGAAQARACTQPATAVAASAGAASAAAAAPLPVSETGLPTLLLTGAAAMLLSGRRRRGRPAPWLARRLTAAGPASLPGA